MGSSYTTGAVSIIDARENARLWLAPAQPCAQATSITLTHQRQHIAPLTPGQGSGVSATGRVSGIADAMPAVKRVTFTAHLGSQVSCGTG